MPLLFVSDCRFELWVSSSHFSLGAFILLRLYSVDKTYSWEYETKNKTKRGELKHYKMLLDRFTHWIELTKKKKKFPILPLLSLFMWKQIQCPHRWNIEFENLPLVSEHPRHFISAEGTWGRRSKITFAIIRQFHWCAPAVKPPWWCIVCHCVMTDLTPCSGGVSRHLAWIRRRSGTQTIALINPMASYWPVCYRGTNGLWRGLRDPGDYTEAFSSGGKSGPLINMQQIRFAASAFLDNTNEAAAASLLESFERLCSWLGRNDFTASDTSFVTGPSLAQT